MLVLGLESTCDETACAIVQDGRTILSNVVASQIDLHAEYGGVVPELACRRHVDVLLPTVDEALKQAKITLADVDLIAVAQGPGLVGALLLGLNAAKALSIALAKPFIGVNHIDAHLYAALMSHETPVAFPALGVILSGGHTNLMQMHGIGTYTTLAETVDDAIGEAFDKVAKILDLPYPGGPHIEALARQGDPHRYAFKAGRVKESPLDFSFSGLKTALLYATKGSKLSHQDKCDLAASFQRAALSDIVHKTAKVLDSTPYQTIVLGGGVTHNQELRRLFHAAFPALTLLWPAAGLSLDNAAMIAGLGYHCFKQQGCGDTLEIEPYTRYAA